MVFPTQNCMVHIFCLIYQYGNNFFSHCKLQNIFTKAAWASSEQRFYQEQHKKLWRILSLWFICGRMVGLIKFSFSKSIETYNNPVCYLISSNLPSPKLYLAAWKCLPTELKRLCEKTCRVN